MVSNGLRERRARERERERALNFFIQQFYSIQRYIYIYKYMARLYIHKTCKLDVRKL